MPEVQSPPAVAESLTELWSPRVIGEVDDACIKVAKVKAEADAECLLLLIERKSTLHTGSTVTDKTQSIAEQQRPV